MLLQSYLHTRVNYRWSSFVDGGYWTGCNDSQVDAWFSNWVKMSPVHCHFCSTAVQC